MSNPTTNYACCNNTVCNPVQDAECLYNAMHDHMRTDRKPLIDIIGRRTNQHLQRVREEYEKLYRKDLVLDIESNTSFNFRKLAVGLVKSYPEYRGEEVHHAMNKMITNKWALIDFIIGNDNRSVEEFKQFFRQKYGTSLVDFIRKDTKGDFETILVKAAEARRGVSVEEDKIDSDVDILYKAGQGKFGTNEEAFAEILTSRSYEHLAFVIGRYQQRYDTTLTKAIKKETSGWFRRALLACLKPPAIHWAKRVRYAVRGLGTDDSLLVNCFSQCSKPFLQQIVLEYQKRYERSLENDVSGDTSGDYRELLLTIIDFPENERLQYVIY